MSLGVSTIGAMNEGVACRQISSVRRQRRAKCRRGSIQMSEVSAHPGRELESQHPSSAQPVGSAAAAIQPRTQPDAGVVEHGLRGRAGQPALTASGPRTLADAKCLFNFAECQLHPSEQAERLAA